MEVSILKIQDDLVLTLATTFKLKLIRSVK